MKPRHIMTAIQNLAPGAEVSFNDLDIDNLVWDSADIKQPTKEAILAEAKRVIENEPVEAQKVVDAKAALLVKLGITADEARLLLS